MTRATLFFLGAMLMVVGCSSNDTTDGGSTSSSGGSSSGASSSGGSSSGSTGSSGDAGGSASTPAVSKVTFCSTLGNACPHGDCESTDFGSGACDANACSAYHDSGFDVGVASSLCKAGGTGGYCLQVANDGDPCNKLGNAGFSSYAVNCAAGVGTATKCGAVGCKANAGAKKAECP